MIRVLFVCMGNICRSPTAQGVFEALLEEQGWQNKVAVDSAGTHAYHVGDQPDGRAIQEARLRDLDLTRQRARRVADDDFEQFDYILAMDSVNMEALRVRCPKALLYKLHLLLEFAEVQNKDVPDPYYGGANGFGVVLDLVESGSRGFLTFLQARSRVD